MISKTTKDFQNEVLNNMTFKPYKTELEACITETISLGE